MEKFKIKTFPLLFEAKELAAIREVAVAKRMTIKEFMYEAIKEKMEKENQDA